jgi:phosphoserine phosphatase RsbU/P
VIKGLLDGARVLVVDDDEVDQMLVRRALKRIGAEFVVTTATSAAEALATLRRTPVDCVLSDLHMPGDDGAWLLERVRTEGLDVPVVVLTGQGDEGVAVALMKAGAADYVPKDTLSPERLAAALRHAIRFHRTEREARRTRERLALALEATGLGTWELDPKTGSVSRDARCNAVYGREETSDVGTVEDAFGDVHPEDRASVEAAMAQALDPASDGRFRSDHRLPPGRGERWVRAEGRVYFLDRSPVRFVGTAQDITRQRTEELDARRRIEFEQQLIGIVSHDLRNPVSAMILGAQLVSKRVPAGSPLAETAGRILSSGDRAARLIRDLLDFTQVRTGRQLPLDLRPADVHTVCAVTVDELSVNYPSRTVLRSSEGDGQGWWDPDRIGQIVGNLLRNAITYSPEGSPVSVRSVGGSDQVTIEVCNDNRAGPIPEEIRATLFQPFQRGERRFDSERSVGLGLFIVSEIVAGHRGSVHLRSDTSGTTFLVRLPRDSRRASPPG